MLPPQPSPVGGNTRPRVDVRASRPWWLMGFAGVAILALAVDLWAVSPAEPPEASLVPGATPSAQTVLRSSGAEPSPGASGLGTPGAYVPVTPWFGPEPTGPADGGPTAVPEPADVYARTGPGMFAPTVANLPPRVYVPDELSGNLLIIDPATFRIIDSYPVGASAQHVTPDWDLQRLFVESVFAGKGRLSVIDPGSGKLASQMDVLGPYNLYFSLDGTSAIVIVDRSTAGPQMYFYDRMSWTFRTALVIPYAGADHMDLTADGRCGLISTEYSGYVVKVDLAQPAVVGSVAVGGKPTDTRLAPDGSVFFVANQARDGVSIVDPEAMAETGFIPTGRGAHGLAFSRDRRTLYVTNRDAGTLSFVDLATRRVVMTTQVGGSPDMIAVSPDGSQLWISNRYRRDGSVSVIDATSGAVIQVIRTGGQPHGLAYWPQPGILSLGHNGNMR